MSETAELILNLEIACEFWIALGIKYDDKEAQRESGYVITSDAGYNENKDYSWILAKVTKDTVTHEACASVAGFDLFSSQGNMGRVMIDSVLSQIKPPPEKRIYRNWLG